MSTTLDDVRTAAQKLRADFHEEFGEWPSPAKGEDWHWMAEAAAIACPKKRDSHESHFDETFFGQPDLTVRERVVKAVERSRAYRQAEHLILSGDEHVEARAILGTMATEHDDGWSALVFTADDKAFGWDWRVIMNRNP